MKPDPNTSGALHGWRHGYVSASEFRPRRGANKRARRAALRGQRLPNGEQRRGVALVDRKSVV